MSPKLFHSLKGGDQALLGTKALRLHSDAEPLEGFLTVVIVRDLQTNQKLWCWLETPLGAEGSEGGWVQAGRAEDRVMSFFFVL